jgi:hypothetical protein
MDSIGLWGRLKGVRFAQHQASKLGIRSRTKQELQQVQRIRVFV